jgi:NitT/TauT family transport system ATP-binding protein
MTGEPGISLQGVTKTFHHRGDPVQAVAGVDLQVSDGEFVSIIGPSGCGKSTLLRLVAGLIDADEGRVTVGGLDPRAARRAKRFGLVPQTPALLPWRTVRDNVTLLGEVNRRVRGPAPGAGAAAEEAVDALIEAVGLRGFERARPPELSGGMQQRVALARAFALGAPVLLMDEPFAALDEITRETMRFLLAEIWGRSTASASAGVGRVGGAGHGRGPDPAGGSRTVLFVTHTIPEAVILSDRVVVLSARPGRVTLEETITLERPRTAAMEDSIEFLDHTRAVRAALARAHEEAPRPWARSR